MAFLNKYCFILISVCSNLNQVDAAEKNINIPNANGKLNFYELPVGQGTGHVIQCPDGSLSFYDLGTSQSKASGFWGAQQIATFLKGHEKKLHNILITHNDFDHYSLLPRLFPSREEFERYAVRNIYISCTDEQLPSTLNRWLDRVGGAYLLRTVAGGAACGPNGVACGYLPFCPNTNSSAPSGGVKFEVLAANLGDCSATRYKNVNSIVTRVTHGSVSVLLAGDFEDRRRGDGTDGAQAQMVDYYGKRLRSTVYQAAHHGASYKANKPEWLDAVRPRVLIANGNPWFRYRHPRCVVLDHLIDEDYLCEPNERDPSDADYCSRPLSNNRSSALQPGYTCGADPGDEPRLEARRRNRKAIYTTAPLEGSMNLVTLSTDGERWEVQLTGIEREETLYKHYVN